MAATKWINFAAGALEGWWLGEGDSRPFEPYVPAGRWDQELQSAGFAGIDSLAYDGYLNNNIVAMPSIPAVRHKRVTLLLRGQGTPLNDPVLELEQHLVQSGYHVDRLKFDEISTRGLPQDQDIVSALDLHGPLFKDLEEHSFGLWEQFVGAIRDSNIGVLWLTRPSQVNNCPDPEYGIAIGLARMLRDETNLDFATVEIDLLDNLSLKCAVNVLDEFRVRLTEGSAQPTAEWAIVGGRALIGRYQPIKVTQEIQVGYEDSTLPDWLAERLYRAEARLQDLGPDDVEIAVKAVGLGFAVRSPHLFRAWYSFLAISTAQSCVSDSC